MNKLVLTDIIKKQSVDNNIVKVCWLDFQTLPASTQNGMVATMSTQVSEKMIELTKPYPSDEFSQECLDAVILEQHIQSLLKKDYSNVDEHVAERRLMEFFDSNNRQQIEDRRFRSKVQTMSSHIAVTGRVGPATTLIIDPKQKKLFSNKDMWGAFKIFTHEGLDNKIILIYINNDKDYVGKYMLLHTDSSYILEEVGDFNKQYHVLEVNCLRGKRIEKLERILKGE